MVLFTGDPEKVTGVVVPLAHSFWSMILFTKGIGFTVMEKDFGAPLQVLETGVT